MYTAPSTKFKNGAYFCLCACVLQIIQKCAHTGVDIDTINYATKSVLSVRFEVVVSLLLAPVGADKRGPKAPFPLVEIVGNTAGDLQESIRRSSGGSQVLLKAMQVHN